MPGIETKESISKYISFDGTDEKWKVFKSQAEALGVKKGWWDSLKSQESSGDDDSKKEKRASAKFFLTMACLGSSAAYVKCSDPWKSWQALLKRYDEVDVADLSTLHKLLNRVINEGPGNEDPEIWFLRIEEVQEDIASANGNPKGDSDLLSQIQEVVSKGPYKDKGELIKTVRNDPDISDYREEMFKYWKANIKPLGLKKDPSDVAFVTSMTKNESGTYSKNGYKYFKGSCHNCGKAGHKKMHCPELKGKLNEERKETRTCHYCGKPGHLKPDHCHKRKNDLAKKDGVAAPQAAFIGYTALQTSKSKLKPLPGHQREARVDGHKSWADICDEDSSEEDLDIQDDLDISREWETVLTFEEVFSTLDASTDSNMWLVDSGATVNVTNDENCLRDAVDIDREIIVGNGQQVTATKQGWTCLKVNKTDKMILKEVLYVKGFVKKIISAPKLCSNGMILKWEGDWMFITSPEGKELRLPRRRNGMCYVLDHNASIVPSVMSTESVMDIQDAHDLLGHASESIIRKTMDHMQVKLSGELKPCEGCLLEKAQRKPVPKVSMKKAMLPCERLLLDTTGPFAPSLRGAIYDVYVACQLTSKSWVFHVKKKSEVPQCLENVLTWSQGKGYQVKFLRCDNAGEHQTRLIDVCAKFGVQIEYTAPNTPQQNGQIERMIAVDRGRRNAMLRASGLSDLQKNLLRAEATQMARRLAQLHVTPSRPVPPGEAIPDGNVLLKPENLKRFGQKGYVTVRKKILNKMEQRSLPMLMVGYAVNHAADTYRMYNPETQMVVESRDVRWDEWLIDENVTNAAQAVAQTVNTTPGFPMEEDSEDEEGPHLIPDDDDGPPTVRTDAPAPRAPVARRIPDFGAGGDEIPQNENSSEPTESNEEIENRRLGREKDEGGENVSPTGPTGIRRNSQREQVLPGNRMQTRSRPRVHFDERDIPSQNSRLGKELAKLDFGVRFRSNVVPDDEDEDDEDEVVAAMVMSISTESDPGEPKTIKEALSGKNKGFWREGMKKEVANFLDRKAWVPCDRDEVLKKGFKPVGTKTVFKVKDEHDGSQKYKVRVVTKGYNMIPGVHFQNSFSPVACDAAIRIVIGIGLYSMNQERKLWNYHLSRSYRRSANRSTKVSAKIQRSLIGAGRKRQFIRRLGLENADPADGWVMEVFDTVAAFLNADPGTEMYISVPEVVVAIGLMTQEEADKTLYRLGKTMYGNVDAALRYFLKFKRILSELGLIQCVSDPCLFFREDENGILLLLVVVHVDDSLITGKKSEVDRFMDEFENYLKIERLGPLRKHLGVWWEFCTDDDGEIYLEASMEKMRNEIILDFEKATGKPVKLFTTPAYPGTTLSSYEGEPVQLTEFRSILGKLLYYVNKIAPAMLNSVRELSSHMSMPGPDHWKAMGRVVGHLKSFEKYHMVFRAPEELRAVSLSDSGYASCVETRRSVGGGIDTLGGMFIGASSKKQPVVSLSSAEAELIAYSERCQAARFAQQLLGEILGQELTAVVFEDNQGCIHLVKNQKTSTRTKHLDVRWLFCRDFYINGKILPVFVRSEENYADGCTKNQGEKLFANHDSVLRGGFIPYRREDVETALATEKQNTERGEAAEPGEPAEFDRGRIPERDTDDRTRGKERRTMARGTGLDLGGNGIRIATGGHSDDRDRSGILSDSESGLGSERDCSLRNKSIETGCQDQENSDR